MADPSVPSPPPPSDDAIRQRRAAIVALIRAAVPGVHIAIDGQQAATTSANGYQTEVLLAIDSGRVDRDLKPGAALSKASTAFLDWIHANQALWT